MPLVSAGASLLYASHIMYNDRITWMQIAQYFILEYGS